MSSSADIGPTQPAAVTLYDAATGVRLGTPITIAEDRQQAIEVWDLDPDHWVAAACRVAGRNLTREEWGTNVGDLAVYRATCPEHPADE